MANLSNINNVLRTNSTGVGIFDDAASYPLEISSATTAGMRLINTAGATYDVYANASEEFLITKVGVGERLSISSGGAITFNNAYTFPTAVTTTNNYVLTAQTDGSTAWAADGGGTVKGTGTATQVAFWSVSSDTISGDADLYWDNVNKRLGIGTDSPSAALEVKVANPRVKVTATTGTNPSYLNINNTGGSTYVGQESSVAGSEFTGTTAYASVFGSSSSRNTQFLTNTTVRMTIDTSGNVGIGTSSPTSPASVGTFLDITGRSGVGGGTAGIVLKDYDNDAWDIWTSGGTLNARYNNSGTSDGFGISSGGDAVFYTSTNQGGLAASSATDNTTVRIINTGTGGQAWRLQSTGGTSGLGQGKLFIKVGGTETAARLVTFTDDGSNINVGIGTTTPQTSLQVNGTHSVFNAHFGQGTNNSSGVWGGISLGYSEAANTGYRKVGIVAKAVGDGAARQDLHFLVDTVSDSNPANIGDTKMMIAYNNGYVGIGNSAPLALLDLGPTGGQKFYLYSDGSTVKAGLGVDLSGSSRELSIFNSSSNGTTGNISFGYRHETGGAYTENMRLVSSGHLGLGTTSFAPTVLKQLKIGNMGSGAVGDIYDANIAAGASRLILATASGTGVIPIISGRHYSAAYGYDIWVHYSFPWNVYFDARGEDEGFIWRNYTNVNAGEITLMDLDGESGVGTLTVKGDVVAYGSPSDKRLKENIKPIESALDKVEKLQGVTFDWKESDSILEIKEDIGFIAQDVQKVVPELVRENENGMLSLRHQGITPILLEAIKELKAEIEELKSKPCNCNNCNCNNCDCKE